MDWLELRATYDAPSGQPERCGRLLALSRVLDGTQYDAIPNPFSRERSGAGEYVPLSRRRPSVRTNLCRTVVDESVSLLFGDTHWPTVTAASADVAQAMATFAQGSNLPAIMMQAATLGSVGSVALLVEAHDGALVVTSLPSAYLTPSFSPGGKLLAVRQRYQVEGRVLAGMGYPIPDDQMAVRFWYERRWDDQRIVVMQPLPVSADEAPKEDDERSATHGLGFVPIVWVRNLVAQGGDEIDGACTFERAIDTVIEADYLLSQGGRALRYASDPTLVIRSGPQLGEGEARQGGAASALTVPPEGDAKLLEINGNSSAALLSHYRELRALVLEQLHGNRAHADKLSTAQSGRAMEMMCQSLIWLADQLRQSYGDGALLPLYRMVCAFSGAMEGGVEIGGKQVRDLDPSGLDLRWPAWFAPTSAELLQVAQGLVTAVKGGLLSDQTACELYAARVGVVDAAQEWARVQAEMAARAAEDATTVRREATVGNTLSHQVEA